MPLISGQKTVATAGTAVTLGAMSVAKKSILVKALPTNTGLVYVGNDGSSDVSSANGYPLSAGEQVVFEKVSNLSSIYVDAAVNGEGVAWLVLVA